MASGNSKARLAGIAADRRRPVAERRRAEIKLLALNFLDTGDDGAFVDLVVPPKETKLQRKSSEVPRHPMPLRRRSRLAFLLAAAFGMAY